MYRRACSFPCSDGIVEFEQNLGSGFLGILALFGVSKSLLRSWFGGGDIYFELGEGRNSAFALFR